MWFKYPSWKFTKGSFMLCDFTNQLLLFFFVMITKSDQTQVCRVSSRFLLGSCDWQMGQGSYPSSPGCSSLSFSSWILVAGLNRTNWSNSSFLTWIFISKMTKWVRATWFCEVRQSYIWICEPPSLPNKNVKFGKCSSKWKGFQTSHIIL